MSEAAPTPASKLAAWMAGLDPDVVAQLEGRADIAEPPADDELLRDLSPEIQKVLARTVPLEFNESFAATTPTKPMYFAIVIPEGEVPRIEPFTTERQMYQEMAEYDNTDTHFFPIFGGIITYTRSGGPGYPRFAYSLDSNGTIWRVGRPVRKVPDVDFECELQGDFFLGAPELLGLQSQRSQALSNDFDDDDFDVPEPADSGDEAMPADF